MYPLVAPLYQLVAPMYPVHCTCVPASRAHCPVAPSKKILEKQLVQVMFCFLFPSFILVHVVPFFSFFHVCFMFVSCGIPAFMSFHLWDSVCFHISPLEFMFPLSLSLFSLVFGSCTAEPLGTRTCRSVHTKKLADHPQFWHETNENCSKDDNRRWENHITIKMKQNDKNDSPKSVADTFSNFSKQINGYAGLTQARNREKTCKSSRVKAKWIWSGKKTGNSTKCWALKPDWQKYAFIV